jgi:tetratricopeptide (TPR) repeat protein
MLAAMKTPSASRCPLPLVALLLIATLTKSAGAADLPDEIESALSRYTVAWEARDPFALVELTPPGSPLFVPLLPSRRFEQVAETRVRLKDVVLAQSEREGDWTVEFTRVHEDVFYAGTVSRGIARERLRIGRVGDDVYITDHKVVGGPGELVPTTAYLSGNPLTWGREHEPAERAFYLAYRDFLLGEYESARAALWSLVSRPYSETGLDALDYATGNQRFIAQVHYFLGMCEGLLDHHDKAEAQIRLALHLEPKFPLALNFLASDAAARGDHEQALELWTASLAGFADQPDVRSQVELLTAAFAGFAESEAREAYLSIRGAPPSQAIPVLQELVRKDRKAAEARRRLATVYLLDYQPAAAEKVLRDNLDVHPGDIESLYLLGRTYLATDRVDEALGQFVQVWGEAPGYRDTLEISAYLGRHRLALGYLRDGARVAPGDPRLLYKTGVLALEMGRRFEGISYLRRARDARPPAELRVAIHKALQEN